MSEIVRAAAEDLPEIDRVYAGARIFMAANGNASQWGPDRYPQYHILERDIALSRLFVLKRGGRIAAAFVLAEGDEPTYAAIEGGAWLNDKPYITVHRMASRADEHGCAEECIRFAEKLCREKGLALRADTHRRNAPMLHVLEKNGFRFCGVIRVRGSERLAFQKEI